MTEKELKHLSRSELLEMLISQGKKVDRLKANLESLNAKLEERELNIERAGSIAEAALNVNGIYEAAQNAADQYLSNVKRLCDERLAEAEKTAKAREAEADATIAKLNVIVEKLKSRIDKSDELYAELEELIAKPSSNEGEETAKSETGSAEHENTDHDADAGEMKKKMIALAKAQAKEEKKRKKQKE